MCEVFISADPNLYASRARSVRLHGVVTSIRLENLFWKVLEEIATRDGMSVPQLCARLHRALPGQGRHADELGGTQVRLAVVDEEHRLRRNVKVIQRTAIDRALRLALTQRSREREALEDPGPRPPFDGAGDGHRRVGQDPQA